MPTEHSTPDDVYECYERAAPQSWVRIAVRFRKVGSDDSWAIGRDECGYTWDQGELGKAFVSVDDNDDGFRLASFYFNEIGGEEGWTEGLMVMDVDGTRSTTLIESPDGVSDDFLETDRHFLDEYLAEHREEMTQLGQDTYGGRRKGLFRR